MQCDLVGEDNGKRENKNNSDGRHARAQGACSNTLCGMKGITRKGSVWRMLVSWLAQQKLESVHFGMHQTATASQYLLDRLTDTDL